MKNKEKIRIGFVLEGKTLNFVEDIIESLSQNYNVTIGYIGKNYFVKNIDVKITELPKTIPLERNFLFKFLKLFVRNLNTHLIALYNERMFGLLPKRKKFITKLNSFLNNFSPKIFSPQKIFMWITKNSNFYGDFLKNINVLIFIATGISDYRIIYEAKKNGKKIINWIYSWDTLFKDKYFIDFGDLYLVWNEEIKRDLLEIYKIDREKIRCSGPIQFDYLKKYKDSQIDIQKYFFPQKIDRYILYPCCRGDYWYGIQEVKLVCEIAKIISRVDKEIKLVVRIYPNTKDFSIYNELKNYSNIVLDDKFGLPWNRLYISKTELEFKVQLIKKASLVINCGTTMVLEASCFDIPICQLNFDVYVPGIPDGWRLKDILKADHLQRYLLKYNLPNIVNNLVELEFFIKDALKNPQKYLIYTHILRKFTDPKPSVSYHSEWMREVMEFVKQCTTLN